MQTVTSDHSHKSDLEVTGKILDFQGGAVTTSHTVTLSLLSVITEMRALERTLDIHTISLNHILHSNHNGTLKTKINSIRNCFSHLASSLPRNIESGKSRMVEQETKLSCSSVNILISSYKAALSEIENILYKLNDIGTTINQSLNDFVEEAKESYTNHKTSFTTIKSNLEAEYNQMCPSVTTNNVAKTTLPPKSLTSNLLTPTHRPTTLSLTNETKTTVSKMDQIQSLVTSMQASTNTIIEELKALLDDVDESNDDGKTLASVLSSLEGISADLSIIASLGKKGNT